MKQDGVRVRTEIFLTHNGQIYAGKDSRGGFKLPGGGVDEGENPHAAVVRELGEETGLGSKHVRTVLKAPTLMWGEQAQKELAHKKGGNKGAQTTFFHGVMSGDQADIFGIEGDKLPNAGWVSPEEIEKKLKRTSRDPENPYKDSDKQRLQALRRVMRTMTPDTTKQSSQLDLRIPTSERAAVALPSPKVRALPGLKTSGMTVDLGENTGSWEQQCFDALASRHPWTAKVNVSISMTATSPSGFGAGFFHLTPKNVPASATSGDRLNVVTIPIIIRAYRLLPLDVFFYKKAFYPLSEERAIRILRLPDLFTDPDRNLMEIERDSLDMRSARGLGYEGRSNSMASYLKQASATSHEKVLKRALWEALSSSKSAHRGAFDGRVSLMKSSCLKDYQREMCADVLRRTGSKDRKKKSAASPFKPLVGAIEVRKTSSTLETRTWWLHHPDDGRPRVDPWTPTQMAKVSAALGSAFAENVITRGWGLRQLATTDAVADTQEEVSNDIQMKLSEAGTVKISEAAGRSGWFQVINPGQKSLLPKTFPAIFIYPPPPGPSLHPSSGGTPAWLAYEAVPGKMIVESLSWEDTHEMSAIPLRDIDPAELGSRSWERGPRRIEEVARSSANASLALWIENGVVRATPVLDKSQVDDPRFGRVMRAVSDSSSHMTDFTHITLDETGEAVSSMVITLPEDDKDSQIRCVLIVPHNALLVHHAHAIIDPPTDAEEDTGVAGFASLSPPESFGSKTAGQRTEELRVTSSPVGFSLYAPSWVYGVLKSSGALQGLTRREVTTTLAGLGVPLASAQKVVSSADRVGTARAYLIRPGQDVEAIYASAEKLSNQWRGALNQVEKFRPHIVEGLARIHNFAKQSAPNDALNALLNNTVDSALQLGFLNVEVISKFANERPHFEESISKLCALLVAVRMGLTEVPEDALEISIRSLDQVLTGLRSLDAAVEVGLS